ncbi:glycosyltransferase [Conexibacter sp. DBS9H8]|uniref:glycosyltransferase n=1 Tax=Conexibacter sp. DBS9H8 TaxID=2937801 RepID=UPI00200F8CF0|nr:glycosyltransferase [Conexibacter sp. DBS9H8]
MTGPVCRPLFTPSLPRRPRVIADGWYSWVGQPDGPHPWTALTAVLARLPEPVARWLPAAGWRRGLVLAGLSGWADAVAVNRYDPGWRTLLISRALLGRRRKLVVLQFFDHPPRGWTGRLIARVESWALGRSLAVAQVLTPAERAVYPSRFGLEPDRFVLIPFAARVSEVGTPPPRPRAAGPVLAAGRAHCDWETLFAAAAGRGWDLEVVVGAADRVRVEALNAQTRAGAHISVELDADTVSALLDRATISVIAVTDGLVGRGHIRLAAATDAGAAIVASDVRSLEGYVRAGVTAELVPPGDPLALRQAVEGLLAAPERRAALAGAAFAAAEVWTGARYVAALQALASAAATTAVATG